MTLPEVADRLEVSISKVHQMIREGQVLAVPRDGVRRIPAELVANRTVLKHLPGILTLLRDAGYDDEEVLGWLYESDDTLPGTPAAALGGDRAREVKRRAQALGF
ncbi:Rv2175c family DNA-binding protein [Plantactinospora sp. GCM10030261]|uniref:Rv2175c family DNA-binding protein n=1 Tax=Plantactinospora sp. GCM10030261 TaxID=3273420 RepID=UPI00360C9B87